MNAEQGWVRNYIAGSVPVRVRRKSNGLYYDVIMPREYWDFRHDWDLDDTSDAGGPPPEPWEKQP